MYDADVLPRRSDAAFSKGSKRVYGEMMSNGDMYTQTVMHNDLPSTTAYDPDYLRKSKPIRFDEEDSEDNTWVGVDSPFHSDPRVRFPTGGRERCSRAVPAVRLRGGASVYRQQLHVPPLLHAAGGAKGAGALGDARERKLHRRGRLQLRGGEGGVRGECESGAVAIDGYEVREGDGSETKGLCGEGERDLQAGSREADLVV